jgi:hypothetical protein
MNTLKILPWFKKFGFPGISFHLEGLSSYDIFCADRHHWDFLIKEEHQWRKAPMNPG